ncbi:MAG: S-layer homology domain-containing protein [Oscillospiraceae bacterium]|nr:S-layer homology domain-containing protein [Oscillospiraceae bacterium]
MQVAQAWFVSCGSDCKGIELCDDPSHILTIDLGNINVDATDAGDGYTVDEPTKSITVTVTANVPVLITGDGTGEDWAIIVVAAKKIIIADGTKIIRDSTNLTSADGTALTVPGGSTITGQGNDITITSNICGIDAKGDLTIDGRLGDIRGGIEASGAITISGTVGDITGGNGIYSNGGVIISGTTGAITGYSSGIWIHNSTLTIEGDGTTGPISCSESYGNGINGNTNSKLIIRDNRVVYISSIYEVVEISDDVSQGILFIGDEGEVLGDVTLKGDLEIKAGQTLTVPDGATLTIPDGKTLENNGAMTNNGKIDNYGAIGGDGGIGGTGEIGAMTIDLENIDPDGGLGYTVNTTTNVITVTGTGLVTIKGDGTNNGDGWRIDITHATNITIEDGTTIFTAATALEYIRRNALTVPNGSTITGKGSGGITITNADGGRSISSDGSYEIAGKFGKLIGTIYSQGTLTISADIEAIDGELDFSGVTASVFGINARDGLTVSGRVGPVTAGRGISVSLGSILITEDGELVSVTALAATHGIYADTDIVIEGKVGSVTAEHNGIAAFSGSIHITETGILGEITSGTATALSSSGSITIKGTTGPLTGGTSAISSNQGDVEISGKTGAITGNDRVNYFGISARGNVEISGETGPITDINGTNGGVTISGTTTVVTGRIAVWGDAPFSLSGSAVVYAASVIRREYDEEALAGGVYIAVEFDDVSPEPDSEGILFIGNEGTVYGDVTLREGLTLTARQTLTVPADATLTVPKGVTLTINGTVVNEGAIDNQGRIDSQDGGMTGKGEFTGNPVEYPIFFPQTAPPPLQAVNEFEHGTITLSDDVLALLAELGGEVRVVLERVELDGLLAAVTKGYELVVSIAVFVDDVKVDVPLTVSLPYTLKDGEIAKGVNVWYLADNGKLTNLNGTYDDGLITFTIAHQSYFVVGYDEALAAWDGRWSDVDGNEYFDAIAFIAWYLTELDETLFAGTGGTRFSPDMMMTRGQFMTVLHKLAGRPEHSNGDGFDDVDEDAWYYDAVLWGYETGIVAGIGGGLFAPDEELSREQMAVILSKYAAYTGLELETLRELPEELEFSDWADEDGYITALAGAGLLTGGGLDLTKGAPRAEIALMFMEFVKLVLE